jgi:hypothetical protein
MLESRHSRFLLNEAAAVIIGGRPLRFLLFLFEAELLELIFAGDPQRFFQAMKPFPASPSPP